VTFAEATQYAREDRCVSRTCWAPGMWLRKNELDHLELRMPNGNDQLYIPSLDDIVANDWREGYAAI
jgi:hypothetical protein